MGILMLLYGVYYWRILIIELWGSWACIVIDFGLGSKLEKKQRNYLYCSSFVALFLGAPTYVVQGREENVIRLEEGCSAHTLGPHA